MAKKFRRLRTDEDSFLSQYRRALSEEAVLHAMAVEEAREHSSFTDETALHAFAYTIRTNAMKNMASYVLVDNTEGVEYRLKNLKEYADSLGVKDTDLFVKLAVEYNEGVFESEDELRVYMREQEITVGTFRSCVNYIALADLLAFTYQLLGDKLAGKWHGLSDDEAEKYERRLHDEAYGKSE